MAAKSSPRNGYKPFLVAIHTNEGPNPADVYPDRTAENLANYMDGAQVSYHFIEDDDSEVPYVPDYENRYSWSLRTGNLRSVNICFTGYAAWSRAEWLRHPNMLARGAARAREVCDRLVIPKVKLTAAQVGADKAGICGHWDWTVGKSDGTHTDPGSGFPWDVFIDLVNGGASQEDDMFDANDRELLRTVVNQLTGSYPPKAWDFPGFKIPLYDVPEAEQPTFTPMEALGALCVKVLSRLDRDEPSGVKEDLRGNILDIGARVEKLEASFEEMKTAILAALKTDGTATAGTAAGSGGASQ
jgi:hypothetical protein